MKVSDKITKHADALRNPKPTVDQILDEIASDVQELENKVTYWFPEAPVEPKHSECFLFEFEHGDRFVLVRYTCDGFENIENRGIVTDHPMRYCHVPEHHWEKK